MARILRKRLDHTTHFAGRFGAIYFITICCDRRGTNQLYHEKTANVLFDTARIYHECRRWNVNLLVLMPDHLHALIGIDGRDSLSHLIRDYKRIITRIAGFGGSEISSITGFVMTKAWLKSSHTSVKIRCASDWFAASKSGLTF
jgi:REP element-mobilizing transposase RayT